MKCQNMTCTFSEDLFFSCREQRPSLQNAISAKMLLQFSIH
uniref:Uncharacterized protein n=1 Tax=Anguilla anguilla TaxID=7936 RepID=A0A0E9WEA2_ANGAN